MLIFVHGMCNIPEACNPVIEYFNHMGFSSNAINLREGLDLRKACFQDYVKKVKKIVKEDDILIGHSLGGLIVLKVAEETRIKAGVAICSAPPKGIKYKINILDFLQMLKYIPKIIKNEPFKPDYSLAKKFLLAGIDAGEEKSAS